MKTSPALIAILTLLVPSIGFAHGPMISGELVLALLTVPLLALITHLSLAWKSTKKGTRSSAIFLGVVFWLVALCLLPLSFELAILMNPGDFGSFLLYVLHFAVMVTLDRLIQLFLNRDYFGSQCLASHDLVVDNAKSLEN
jgi:hypothetical protein